MKRTGLALIVVVGILGVLALLAAAFVAMAQLERRASQQRVHAAKAYLLARSGVEDALARLELGQDSSYGGENWDGDAQGILSSFEAAQEVHHRTGAATPADVEDCPVRHAMRPSFHRRISGTNADPDLLEVDGRKRGYSGGLAGDWAREGNSYALKVSSLNGAIYINGGALDDQDRDPDGLAVDPSVFPLNPLATAEVTPRLPNLVPDHKDTSMEGPNGFLVRLLNNLDAVVTSGAASNLGVQVVEGRPVGGYTSLDELKPVLGQARFDRFRPYLTLHAWVDASVVKPQPMDGRPCRWEDIDDAHRIGAPAIEISGVRTLPATVFLNPLITGSGTEALPWQQQVTATNLKEGIRTYPVIWERNFVYAWHQLRLAPVAIEPRAPVAISSAPAQVLASIFLGLKGTYLEVWDGSAGWDGGFGFTSSQLGPGGVDTYPYPAMETEDAPWHRARVDYGMTYGVSTLGTRPWYGPTLYDPQAPLTPGGSGGKPVVYSAPLGRLKETPPITLDQALALAGQVRQYRAASGSFRAWGEFHAFVGCLPRWEDLDDNGTLDGSPYQVAGSGSTYTRRIYRREDLDSDGRMRREIFTPASGSWVSGTIVWQDPGLGRSALGAAQVPGLTFIQKDVLKAMADPNTDVNDFNPDANLFKEVDKTDLAGIGTQPLLSVNGIALLQPDPDSYVHTTEFSLEAAGTTTIHAVGRVLGAGGRLQARARHRALVKLSSEIYRDTTQADFMRGYAQGRPLTEVFSGPVPPYDRPMAGGQPLVSYPEPQTAALFGKAIWTSSADAAYDGQISLGFIGTPPGPDAETIRGDLFDTPDATGATPPDLAVPDLRGPRQGPLLGAPALPVSALGQAGAGNVFPDGVYSEKDRALKFGIQDNISTRRGDYFYVACWVKPNWLPEASPRPHALVSLSRGAEWLQPEPESGSFLFVLWFNPYDIPIHMTPLDDILAHPVGLYFVPARNNLWQDAMGNYDHSPNSTRGRAWPRRALLWGTTHSLFASDTLNRRGIEPSSLGKPPGRLDGRRWTHVAMMARIGVRGADLAHTRDQSRLVIARTPASVDGGGWMNGFGLQNLPIGANHVDGTPNHLRFGEVAAEHNMNYVADATFAGVRAGWGGNQALSTYELFFKGTSGPAAVGRYYKESRSTGEGATYTSSRLPAGIRPLRITWTEVPCDLWFDRTGPDGTPDGWLDSLENDRDGNGRRDVHIEMEVWDDMGTSDPADDVRLARFDDPAADNRIPPAMGRVFYKAIFVNEWDPDTRANFPLDVTPYLDDVTIEHADASGPRILAWGSDED